MNIDVFYFFAWVMAMASGIMAGVYLTFSVVIMRSLSRLDPAEGIAAMNTINREIVKTAFMPLFFGSTILAVLMIGAGIWLWGNEGATGIVASGFIYFIGMFMVTALGNVPLNNKLDRVEGAGLEAVQVWTEYLSHWTRWNTVRSVACATAMVICIDQLSI